jgi:hypothetical protein
MVAAARKDRIVSLELNQARVIISLRIDESSISRVGQWEEWNL